MCAKNIHSFVLLLIVLESPFSLPLPEAFSDCPGGNHPHVCQFLLTCEAVSIRVDLLRAVPHHEDSLLHSSETVWCGLSHGLCSRETPQMGQYKQMPGAGRAQVNRRGTSHGPMAEVDRHVLLLGWDVSRGAETHVEVISELDCRAPCPHEVIGTGRRPPQLKARGLEIAQLGNCLPCKHQELSCSYRIKRLGAVE